MRAIFLTAIFAFSGSGAGAFAQDIELCKQFSNAVQPGCREFLFELADDEMQAALAAAIQRMQYKDRYHSVDVYEKTLEEAQSTWLASRDPHCRMRAIVYREGSAYGQTFWPCLTRETQARAAYLREQLDLFHETE